MAPALYRDYLNGYSWTTIKERVRARAWTASNCMGLPIHRIVTDGNAIVRNVTRGFVEFTGYSEDEMLGRKCNFLQGEETDPNDIVALGAAVRSKRGTSVVILNYRKDGMPFWNILTIKPQIDASNTVVAFTGEIIGLLMPEKQSLRPRLCLEDALALISVFSSIPRGVPNVRPVEDAADLKPKIVEKPLEALDLAADENMSYKHIDYSHLASTLVEDAFSELEHRFIAETSLPTEKGTFRVRAYRNVKTGAEPLAMIIGDVEGEKDVICRVHDQCVTSEVFGSVKCDCKQQLDYAMEFIQTNKSGIVFYLPQEGRGIGIANKIAAYSLQESGLDTVDANRHLGLPDDAREYSSVRDILKDLNIPSVKIMTNNPRKIECLQSLGVKVNGRMPCIMKPNSEFSRNYVQAKAQRMGHMIELSSLR